MPDAPDTLAGPPPDGPPSVVPRPTPVHRSGSVTLKARRDSRLVMYGLIAAGAAAIALLSGEPGVMAIAAACLAAAVWSASAGITVDVEIDTPVLPPRLIEGDALEFGIEVRCPPGHDLAIDVVGTSPGFGPIRATSCGTRPGTVRVECSADADAWGRYALGQVVARVTKPGSAFVWQQAVADLGRVTVLPTAERLDRMLAPAATHISAGQHPSARATGDGVEFAEIRQMRPGDRLRDVNWKATARRTELQVNQRLPERGGDVIVVIDAVPDGIWHQSDIGRDLLQTAGRAAWALIQNHLRAHDRVGVVIHHAGGVQWLPPRGGRRARYRLLERLLIATDPLASDRPAAFDRHDIPKSALVVGISSLVSDANLRELAALRTHGREVCVLSIDQAPVLRRHDVDTDTIRLASLFHDARVRYLRRLSTPVVVWRPGDDIDRSIRHLSDLTRRMGRRVS